MQTTMRSAAFTQQRLPSRSAGRQVMRGQRNVSLRVARPPSQQPESQQLALPQQQQRELPNVFEEPFWRSLILGVVAGGVCESVHVAMQTLSTAVSSGVQALPAVPPSELAPWYVPDHIVALGAWLALYALEAAAIVAVLDRFPDSPEKQARSLEGLSTLPKRLLPISLDSVRRTAYRLARGDGKPAAATAVAPAAPKPPAARRSAVVKPTSKKRADAMQKAMADAAVLQAAMASMSGSLMGSLAGSMTGSMLGSLDLEDAVVAPVPDAGPSTSRERRRTLGRPGRWQQGSGQSRREKELQDRKGYLKNFWYAAALSDNVKPGVPLGVDILGTRVTLFRGEDGSVSCIDDTCPHRGAPLSEGWVQKDPGSGKSCVVCPYHGWAFDGEGRLRDVPSAEPGRWPRRPLVASYPVEERGGFVWLFYGDSALPAEERPPIPFVDELDSPDWIAVYGELEFNAPHWPVFENAIDMAHIHYLHSFGNADKPRIDDMRFEKDDCWSIKGDFHIHNKPPSKLWEWTAVPAVPVSVRAFLPSTSAVKITLAGGVQMITFVNTVPIDEHRSINRFCLIRNFAGWRGFDFWAEQNMYKILGEDKVMVEKLAAERLAAEYSFAPDAPQIAFRQLRQEWVDMGYVVTPEEARKPRKPASGQGRKC